MKQIEQILRLNYTTKDVLRLVASTKYKIALMKTALCLAHAEPELTARPWFRVLNSHQGQSAYSGFSRRAGHRGRNKFKTCGFHQMQDCTGGNGIVPRARR